MFTQRAHLNSETANIFPPDAVSSRRRPLRRPPNGPFPLMNDLNVVVALITRDNDYQAEQSKSAIEAAERLGARVQVIFAGNDAVNQTQQLVKLIQDPAQRPSAILVEPVGTGMPQVAKAAIAAGIAWGLLNREPEYSSELLHDDRAPIFAVTTDQEEVGRIQGKQLGVLASDGNVLYIEGPFSSGAAQLRTKGMLSTKPPGAMIKAIKGDWTEHSAHQAVKSWLGLSTSRQLHIRAVMCQNDAMAMGARRAFLELAEKDRERWLDTPFTGCDGVAGTGQEWVRRGMLRATVVTPPTAALALELFVKAVHHGSRPPQRTLSAPRSFPKLEELVVNRPK
jgi:ABC-type sugar transport system substrate-binding protein